VKKSELLKALQQAILRHDFDCFVGDPPSIAQGGKGVVVPGCPTCKKRINTMNQFLHDLAEDAMPALSGPKTPPTSEVSAAWIALLF
jgi:hypothetical protein